MNINSLQRIMLSMAEARMVGPILDEIVRGVGEAFDLALARLWFLQDDEECPVCSGSGEKPGRVLHLRASAGKSKQNGKDYSGIGGKFHRVVVGERKIGQIAESGKPMLIDEVSGDEAWVADREWMRGEGIQSFAGQPLIFRGETLGVLAVFSRSAFSAEEFKWLRTSRIMRRWRSPMRRHSKSWID